VSINGTQMGNTHYLKREKDGKVIQLWIITEQYDEFGYHKTSVKFDIDPKYKTAFTYIQYPVPHEELKEISFVEFQNLCKEYNCLTHNSALPEPQAATGLVACK